MFLSLAQACLLVNVVTALAVPPELVDLTGVTSKYAPKAATCPREPLVRPAVALSHSESTYVSKRTKVATKALQKWLKNTSPEFCTHKVPSLGLAISGGGYRSLLNGAGVIQGLDARDSTDGPSGIYQGLTYHAGLSGGAWLLSSFYGNNNPTITSLKTGLWETAFQNGLTDPDGAESPIADAAITVDITSKQAAGFPPTLVDPYGRLLSYQLLLGNDGGVADTWSGVTANSNFTSHAVPFPIITALGVNDQCTIPANATQYEITPYDFGSWDKQVYAFTRTAYLGTNITNGQPSVQGECITNYDNLGFVLGTSSDIFGAVCEELLPLNSSVTEEFFAGFIDLDAVPEDEAVYALYPNPFKGMKSAPAVSDQKDLTLVDGGLSNQNNPIWPFLQSSRDVSVLIVNDNSADTSDNFPNGTEIYNTYTQAHLVGGAVAKKMPTIPPVSTFVSQGLNKRATFFGCDEPHALTIVYLPNVAYSYASNPATAQIQYTKAETDGIIGNGVQIASQNGTEGWSVCLGCAIQKKAGGCLPRACGACFEKYCYKA